MGLGFGVWGLWRMLSETLAGFAFLKVFLPRPLSISKRKGPSYLLKGMRSEAGLSEFHCQNLNPRVSESSWKSMHARSYVTVLGFEFEVHFTQTRSCHVSRSTSQGWNFEKSDCGDAQVYREREIKREMDCWRDRNIEIDE
jgi:hypothetical protein